MNQITMTPQNDMTLSWISPKIILENSSIEGQGYIAKEKIKKDEKLIVQSGRCIHVTDIDTFAEEACWYYGFQIEIDVYCYPFFENQKPYLDGIFKINHSCEPNAGFAGQITLVAMRDINEGEEITYDYAMTDIETEKEDAWETETCICNTTSCRGHITGHDWKLEHLQKKYGTYFSAHVIKQIQLLKQSDTL